MRPTSIQPIWSSGDNPLGLRALEVAAGVVLGTAENLSPARNPSWGAARQSPFDALASAAVELLEMQPCAVAFSGGRDSSAVLAVLAQTARREGLPLPVACTTRWEDDANSDEREWQEHVISYVGIDDWEVVTPGDDLDLLGPVARDGLCRHGLLWPAPAYAIVPLLHLASGGVLVTGEGGDEVFGDWALAAVSHAWRTQRRFTARQARSVVLAIAPRRVQYSRLQRSEHPYQSWLRPVAVQEFRELMVLESMEDLRPWKRYLGTLRRRRSCELMLRSTRVLAEANGASYAAPLLDPRFTAALGADGGLAGCGNRTDILKSVFSEVLDDAILSRVSKAHFGNVFWSGESREFARNWDGHGLPEDMIDPEVLRAAWLTPLPVYGAALPLQAAWLATRRGREQEDP